MAVVSNILVRNKKIEFRVLVGVPYKSGTCATMLVAKEDVHEEPSSSLEQQQSAVEDAGAKPVAPPAEAKVRHMDGTRDACLSTQGASTAQHSCGILTGESSGVEVSRG